MAHSFNRQSGLGLIEALVTLTLIAALAGWGMAHYRQWLAEASARSARSEVRTLINYARQTSVAAQQPLLLCGSANGHDCDGQWQRYIILRSAEANSDTAVLARFAPDTRITLQGPGAARQFHPQPTKNMVNATFRFCLPANAGGAAPKALLLIVNAMGRLREETQAEDANCL